jgi:3,4-dihydroxyphthalate decarboxylase
MVWPLYLCAAADAGNDHPGREEPVTADRSSSGTDAARHQVALACRVLARAGLTESVLGHVSMRIGPDRMALRCRGPRERGLLFTEPDDVHVVALDASGDLDRGYHVPHEHPIHGELYRRHADVQAVVHAHPMAPVVCSLAGIDIVDAVGAWNIPASRLGRGGVPVYPRSVLVSDVAVAGEMADALGDRPAGVLTGHGVVTFGVTVAEAVTRALDLDALARVCLEVARAGAVPQPIPAADADLLPDLGPGLNDEAVWQFHVARLEHEGLGLPAVPGLSRP